MTTPWRKAVRDFQQEGTRTAMVVLAIALGIAAFAAVLASYAVLTRALNEGYLATNPASATLRTDAVSDNLLRAVLLNREVSDAEARRVVNGRIKAGPAEWRNLVLFVVQDFRNIRVSTLVPQQGAWPPATGEILIERDAFQVARARIGDSVLVKTAQGKEQTLRVSGSVHDVGQAQARMENMVYGYITLDTLALLGEEPYLDQLKILVADDRFNEKHIRNVAEDVKQLVESQGHPVRRVDVPPPGKHPHADIMGLLLLSMSSFGLFVLLLSGILVINLLTAIMASQIRQIGMMKAIGGSQWQIAQIYFLQALFLGVSAVCIALPAGVLGSRALCRFMAVFLNFDINSFAVPFWVYLLVASVGLVTPVLAAMYPVWNGSSVSVREALADFGVSQNTFGTGAFDRALAGISGTARPLLLALRNSFRRRMRLTLTLLTLALGGLFFMTAFNIRASFINTLDKSFAAKKYDLLVNLGTMYPVEKIDRAVQNTPGILHAENWITTEAAIPSASDAPPSAGADHALGNNLHGSGVSGGDRFPVIALPAQSSLIKMEIVEGRGLLSGEIDALVMNSALAAKQPQIKVGTSVTLQMGPGQTTWRVVGIAREPFFPAIAYIPKAFFEQSNLHPGMANRISLELAKDKTSIGAVKAGLDRNLELEGVRALSSTSLADSRFGFDQHMVMIYVFLILVACIIGGVGGLGLMTTMSLNVLERRREMGVLRAIGASPRMVWLIVVTESSVVGLLSWALAGMAAWPVSKILGSFMVMLILKSGLDFYFAPLGLLIWLVVSILMGAISSFLPAWRASQCPVREAIGYE